MTPLIDVIIPTTCESRRWASLERAIRSVLSQDDVGAKVLVIVNGDRFDAGCYAELRERPGIEVHYQKVGSLPLALRTGRSLVSAPFFSFLDDDDEYLAGTLAYRLQPLLSDPTLDCTVAAGVRCDGGIDRPSLERLDARVINEHPLHALAIENWLASCGGLYRSSRISIDYFDGETKYYEWTYLAYKLALERRLLFLDRHTWRINDSSESLSKSTAYRLTEVEVLRKIAALELPGTVRRETRKRIGAAHHGLSEYYLGQRRFLAAWKHHLVSLACPGGLRYAPYSRHLLCPLSKRDKERTPVGNNLPR